MSRHPASTSGGAQRPGHGNLDRQSREQPGYGRWAIERLTDNLLLGIVILKHPPGADSQPLPDVEVGSSADQGLPPLQVEAAAFAWLARRTVRHEPGSLASVTGARGPRVLGAIFPA